MIIDRQVVNKVARLAMLDLSESEEELYIDKLGRIVDFVEGFQNLNLKGQIFEPTLATPTRSDDPVSDGPPIDDTLSQSPKFRGSSFQVPKIVEK